jgi:hypothetical protein
LFNHTEKSVQEDIDQYIRKYYPGLIAKYLWGAG